MNDSESSCDDVTDDITDDVTDEPIEDNNNSEVYTPRATLNRQQSKTLILSKNIDKKSLETDLMIAICRLTGDKWQS